MTNPDPLTEVELLREARKAIDPADPDFVNVDTDALLARIDVALAATPAGSGVAGLADELSRLIERLVGISTPRMEGDNLAILLCSHFDDGGEPEDDTGWSPAATGGYDEVVNAIADHFSPILQALRQSPPLPSIDEVERVVTEEAAKRLYGEWTNNHPLIHSNRFPSWKELSEENREEYRTRALSNMRVDAPKGLDDG